MIKTLDIFHQIPLHLIKKKRKKVNNNKKILFGIGLFLTSCITSRNASKHNYVDEKIILDSTILIFERKAEIPYLAKRAFESIFPEDKRLADKGAFFTETDLHSVHLPNRRLILGGKKYSDHIGFIVYETGGSIPSPSCLIYSGVNARRLQHILIIGFQDNVRDISSVRKAILLNQFELIIQIDY